MICLYPTAFYTLAISPSGELFRVLPELIESIPQDWAVPGHRDGGAERSKYYRANGGLRSKYWALKRIMSQDEF